MKTPDYPNAEARRDNGIDDSAEHAEHDMPGWIDDAVLYARQFAVEHRHDKFLAEDLRYWATKQGLPQPPELRVWGAVIRAASKAGYIARVGYGSARSSNLSPKVLWAAGDMI